MTEFDYKITGREKIQVPAGAFDCFRIEGSGVNTTPKGGRGIMTNVTWWAPERVRRFVAYEMTRKPPPGSPIPPLAERYELIEFQQT